MNSSGFGNIYICSSANSQSLGSSDLTSQQLIQSSHTPATSGSEANYLADSLVVSSLYGQHDSHRWQSAAKSYLSSRSQEHSLAAYGAPPNFTAFGDSLSIHGTLSQKNRQCRSIGSPILLEDIATLKKETFFDTDNDTDFPTLGGTVKKETDISDETQMKKTQQKSFANIAAKAPVLRKLQSTSNSIKTPNSRGSLVNYPPIKPPSLNQLKINDTIKLSSHFERNVATTSKDESQIPQKLSLNYEQSPNKVISNFVPILAESQFDDLFERDPYLNHMRSVQEDVLLQINEIVANDNFIIPIYPITEHKTEIAPETPSPVEWRSVVSRRRKTSLSTEYSSHRPSPFTDDGYMEDYSDEDESGFAISGFDCEFRTDSPSSSIVFHSDNDGLEEVSGISHLDNKHIFYRTHICIFWQNWNDGKGPKCRHGEDCFYAHGSKKLKKLNPIYYKTVLCEKFNNGNTCPYGENCNFAHGHRELREFLSRAASSSNINTNKEAKKFFSVAKRYHIRKQRGMQTIQCTGSTGKRFDKVKLVKTKENGKINNNNNTKNKNSKI